VVGALLLLVLGLAALLAVQVQTAATYHRHTAEGVLRDYAALAASRIAASAHQAIYARVAQPMIAAAEGSAAARQDASVRYHFHFDPKTRRLRTSHGSPSAAATGWLADTLAASTAAYDSMWYFAATVGGPAAEPAGLAVYRRSRDGQFVGGVTDLATLTPILADAVGKMALLPRSLTRGVFVDSAGGVRIGDATGHTIYASETHEPSPFVGREAIAPWLGGLWAEATLRPGIASRLIAGGVPRSRLPIALGVLAVAAALTVAALLLIRRESELARLRTDLVAGVSHELRTPLAQIRMFSETLLLERVRSDDERQRSLAIIDQEARRLTQLVENLLHFSRAERQLTRVALRPVDLADVVRQATEAFTPLAQARSVTLRGDAASPLPGTADPDALRQIVLNLLDNAVKYGPAGQTVTVGLGATGGQARLTVDDQGPGVPPGDRDRVWERFFRLPRDREAPAPGTGIGLAVVRELVALHGGRAWVESAPDSGGARFVVEWPLAPQAREP
jgi:signal transduction histidine kinase